MTATSACEVEPWSSDTLLASWVVVGKLQIDVKNGTREQMMKPSLLTVEEKELLAKAATLMEELVETVEVAEDEEIVQDTEAASSCS